MLTDIKSRMSDINISRILANCLFEPTQEKLNRLADEYRANGNRFMLGYEFDGRIVACAGVELTKLGGAILRHIAVDPECRGQGIGREMIDEIMRRFALKHLEAETDGDAVGFYRNCGFEITNLGEKYPGCVRYRCVKLKK